MTEEESYDLDMHLTTKWGMRILIPLAIGIILIALGVNTLPIGAIAIVIGIVVIIYGLQRHIRTTSESKRKKN